MSLWLELFLAGTVGLVAAGAVAMLWLLVEKVRPGRPPEPEANGAPPVVRGGLDYRDHPGPVVERQGPSVTERRYRDAIDRTSGENPRT
ncbi:hypothetical protein [Ornithinimicrobium cavernae]|uniref:hypothetical protein n=1 Tax=Ornithinimicrobium cavernae TaxID=2666047 RepID=UPI000D693043|nr:hypothetical protein [Ornithinimicrobium cavernae]